MRQLTEHQETVLEYKGNKGMTFEQCKEFLDSVDLYHKDMLIEDILESVYDKVIGGGSIDVAMKDSTVYVVTRHIDRSISEIAGDKEYKDEYDEYGLDRGDF